MSAPAYLLVKFDDKQKLVAAVDAINGNDKIVNWDAIDGHYNLLLKLVSDDSKIFDFVKSLDGFEAMSSCTIEKDNHTVYDLDDAFTYSYLFIETDNGSKDAVYKTIADNSAGTFCSPTTGYYHLVAQVKAETFDQLDRLVKTDIKQIDGILRYKQDYVIFLDRI